MNAPYRCGFELSLSVPGREVSIPIRLDLLNEWLHHYMRPLQPNPEAYDTALQDGLVDACERLSGVKLRA
jgi:hypothetical protein